MQETVGLTYELSSQVDTRGPLGIAYRAGRAAARKAKRKGVAHVVGMPTKVWALVLADATGRSRP